MICNKCLEDKEIHLMTRKDGSQKLCKACRNEHLRKKFGRNGFYSESWRSEKEAFCSRFSKSENGCWEWLGVLNKYGYGVFTKSGKRETASRASYRIFKGEIPDGKIICHTCDNRKCVNPDHLYAGTWQSNMDDRKKRGRQKYPIGSQCGAAKLKEEDVLNILNEVGNYREIGERYGVSWNTIRSIKLGISWKHVKRQ